MGYLRATVCIACVTLVLGLPNALLGQTVSTGALTETAPVFLQANETSTPLTTLARGTVVRILERQGDWLRIEFRASASETRTGYVRADSVAVRPSMKPQVPPRRPAARPQIPPSSAARRLAQATSPGRAREPLTISLNGGLQATSRNFEAASTFEAFREIGTLNSTYASDTPYVFDVGVQVGVWRALSLGIAATQASKPLGGNLTAEVPHPFFFNKPRSVTGTLPALRRDEISIHLDAAWTVPAGSSTRMTIFAGPSYFQVTQGLITALTVSEEYPYDSASFMSATTTETTRRRWGYNVGVDVTQRAWKSVGVGFIGRYSRASFTFPIASEHNVTVQAGGFQAGGGVRFQF